MVLVSKDNKRVCRDARVKRTTITAIECVSAIGKYLNSIITGPRHRANWVTHPTPGLHYAYSDSGYTDSYISLQWLQLVFDPQTKEQADRKPRVLICDGFRTHETLEILEFCFKNNIILCRLPYYKVEERTADDVKREAVYTPKKIQLTLYIIIRPPIHRLERKKIIASSSTL